MYGCCAFTQSNEFRVRNRIKPWRKQHLQRDVSGEWKPISSTRRTCPRLFPATRAEKLKTQAMKTFAPAARDTRKRLKSNSIRKKFATKICCKFSGRATIRPRRTGRGLTSVRNIAARFFFMTPRNRQPHSHQKNSWENPVA